MINPMEFDYYLLDDDPNMQDFLIERANATTFTAEAEMQQRRQQPQHYHQLYIWHVLLMHAPYSKYA